MKKRLNILLTIFIIFLASSTSSTVSATQNTVNPNEMMATIEVLSTYPRGHDNEEKELARKLIIDTFKKYGLTVTTQTFDAEFFDWEKTKEGRDNLSAHIPLLILLVHFHQIQRSKRRIF